MICDGLAYMNVVCEECIDAVKFLRSVDNLQQLRDFLQSLPEWQASIQILKQKAMESWIKDVLDEQNG